MWLRKKEIIIVVDILLFFKQITTNPLKKQSLSKSKKIDNG